MRASSVAVATIGMLSLGGLIACEVGDPAPPAAPPPAPPAGPPPATYTPAAALSLAWITGGFPGNPLESTAGDVIFPAPTAKSTVTIENESADEVRLLIDVIRGDADTTQQCRSTSFVCDVSAGDMATLEFENIDDDLSSLMLECNGSTQGWFVPAQNGIVFAAVADPDTGDALAKDAIVGHTLVEDTMAARSFTLPGFEFLKEVSNDGNKTYLFDGQEYNQPRDFVFSDVIAPADGVTTQFILYTLDFTIGATPQPRVLVGTEALEGGASQFAFTYVFDCFDVVELEDLDTNFGGFGAGADLEVVFDPIEIGTLGTDVHDIVHGDWNGSRRRFVQGWRIEEDAGGDLTAARLDEDTNPFEPFEDDPYTALDAFPW